MKDTGFLTEDDFLSQVKQEQIEKEKIANELVKIGFFNEKETFDILTENLFSLYQWKKILVDAKEKSFSKIEKYQLSGNFGEGYETILNFLPYEKETAIKVFKAFRQYGNPFGHFKLFEVKKDNSSSPVEIS